MPPHIAIVGAGLVGSLLAVYLRRRGFDVSVFERRPDMRSAGAERGRSINLALSTRGIKALEEVGLSSSVTKVALPMQGRMMHDPEGRLSFLPYGKEGQFINSVSRSALNIVLMNEAEKLGAVFHFQERCMDVDFANTTLALQNTGAGLAIRTAVPFDFIVGADGAFSAVRLAMQLTDRFDLSQDYIEHGYKELHIPAGAGGVFQLRENALHIWPRQSYMLIALPNPDAGFTCTLFFPFDGLVSFSAMKDPAAVDRFFQQAFPDARLLLPDFLRQWDQNPTSSLVTVKCKPWFRKNVMLIGDAAHAIVPFFGQGMNSGFEDCRILNRLLDQMNDDWNRVIPEFENLRKPDTDAVAELALGNFVEMRDLVGDPKFLLRKKIEARLSELFPDKWIPLYSMVTFRDDIRYSTAHTIGQKQKVIMDEVMHSPGIESNWENLDFAAIANRL